MASQTVALSLVKGLLDNTAAGCICMMKKQL